jgi:hypothetical protein
VSDGVRLPRLTREELVALGDQPALVDADDQAWWDDLDETQRGQVVEGAWRGLLARDLARSTRTGLEADARLRFIVTARHSPAWLAVASADTVLRAHGLQLPEGPYVLLEHRPVPGVANFVGMKLEPGLDAVVAFLLRVPPDGQDTVTRRLEVFHPEPYPATERRLLLVGDHVAQIVTVSTDGEASAPTATDPASLGSTLRTLVSPDR